MINIEDAVIPQGAQIVDLGVTVPPEAAVVVTEGNSELQLKFKSTFSLSSIKSGQADTNYGIFNGHFQIPLPNTPMGQYSTKGLLYSLVQNQIW